MEVHVCVENCEREFFVTQINQIVKHNVEKNLRVEPDLEAQILDELGNADFEQVSDELSIKRKILYSESTAMKLKMKLSGLNPYSKTCQTQ